MLRYCPKCGGLMMPQRKDGETWLKCVKCGYEEKAEKGSGYRVSKRIRHGPRDSIIIIEKDVKIETLPKTRVICPECGYVEAYYWEMQTRSGDEPATRFFKCVKCGHVWREYQ